MGRMVVALLAVAVYACGPPGDRPRAGWSVFDSPEGGYRIHYQAPPWRIVDARGRSVELAVPSTAERFVPDAGLFVDPKYRLRVDLGPGEARSRIDEDAARASSRGDTIVAGPRRVVTDVGDRGFELLTLDEETRRFRVVHLDRPGGGVLTLRFDANPVLDDPQVDAMVTGVEVAPEPEI
jgi:hypothetical protein